MEKAPAVRAGRLLSFGDFGPTSPTGCSAGLNMVRWFGCVRCEPTGLALSEPGKPQSTSVVVGSYLCAMGDSHDSCMHDPATCGGFPAQHSIVHKLEVEDITNGVRLVIRHAIAINGTSKRTVESFAATLREPWPIGLSGNKV